MPTYTNPTGTISATDGDDTIIFNARPTGTGFAAVVDALAGHDSLLVQFDSPTPMTFEALSTLGGFYAHVSTGPYDPQIVVENVESVEFHGSANADTFTLQVGSDLSGLTVAMDGGAGSDLLKFDWSRRSDSLSFAVSGSTVTSTFGTFTNFETFEIHGGSGNDTITTGAGSDSIYTGTGVDNVSTGAGNDSIYSESSGGSVDGGDGIDYYGGNFSATTSPLSITIDTGIHVSNGVVVTNVESFQISGGSGDDSFTVTREQNSATLYGGGGHDTLIYNASSSAGLQILVQGYSGDQLSGHIGPLGNSLNFEAFESVSISGTQFNDQLQLAAVPLGSGVSFDGGAGIDSLNAQWAGSTSVSFIVASDGTITTNAGHFANIENFTLGGGSAADTFVTGNGADFLTGGAGADHLDAGAGDDILFGYGGNGPSEDDGAADVLVAGAGDDTVDAGYGDSVDGGTGTDKLDYYATSSTVGITADFSLLTAGGSISVGEATLSGIEIVRQVFGSNHNDTIIAGIGGSTIYGRAGDDHLSGSSGADTIYGDQGNDTLSGGLGADTLNDYEGDNTFADTAAGLNGDTINGFDLGDTIIISNANLASFTFSLSGNVLTYTGGSLYLNASLPGKLVASAAPGGGVQLQVQLPPLATNDQIADQLVNGYWGGTTGAHHFNVTQGGTITVNITGLNATEKTLARAALAEWGDVIGVHFQEVTGGEQILFTDNESGAFTEGNWSGGITTHAHVNVMAAYVNPYDDLSSYGFQTYLHEIGHALGLGHSGDYNGDANYGNDALFLNDSVATSVMSYFDQSQNYYFATQRFSLLNVGTPMQADIVAMQSIYGLSTTTRTGDTVYGYHSNAGGVYDAATPNSYVAFTIVDSGGNDTLDYSNVNYPELINLNPETFSNVLAYTGNLSIGRGTIIENAIAGFGPDTLIGNGVDNVLTGGAGADTLTGGAGNDTFKDTAANSSGDTIVDFSGGDRIVLTDATLAGFTFSLSGNTLTYTGGSMTLSAPIVGHLVASAAAGGGVQLTIQTHDADNDFNGDGRSDVLWRNDNGSFTNWLARTDASGGLTSNDANAWNVVPTIWHVIGTGDFNGDGKDDIVWRHDNGSFTEWLANGSGSGGFSSNDANAWTVLPNSWQVAGTGDFNGDRKDDLIWRNDNGSFTEWLAKSDASGGFTSNDANAWNNVPTSWHVVGTGDFNGDGRDDMLWRNDNGSFTEWLAKSDASGGFTSNDANAWNVVPSSWHVVGTGDFNGDGKDDVLWRNDNGSFTEWLAKGDGSGGFTSNDANAWNNVPSNWHVADVGDFNGDGKDDVTWRNDDGRFTEWLARSDGSGGFTSNDANAMTGVPGAWHVQSPDSFWL